MTKYPSPEDIKHMKEYIEMDSKDMEDIDYNIIVLDYITPKMKHLREIYKNKKDAEIPFLILSAFFSEEEIGINHYDILLDLSIKHKISFGGVLSLLIGWEFAEIKRINNNNIYIGNKLERIYFNNIKNFTQDDFANFIFEKMIKIYDSSTNELSENSVLYQRILKNSFNEINRKVENNLFKTDLPLDQYNITSSEVLHELYNHEKYMLNILNNKSSLKQIEQNNHFLSYLNKDKLTITDDYNIVFSGHTDSFSIGYTDKAISLSLDKKTTIRELESNLKVLSKYTTEDSKGSILLTEALLEFVKQNKAHAKYIPYKALAKIMGISKNEVARHAKEFVGIREKSFLANFDSIKTYTT